MEVFPLIHSEPTDMECYSPPSSFSERILSIPAPKPRNISKLEPFSLSKVDDTVSSTSIAEDQFMFKFHRNPSFHREDLRGHRHSGDPSPTAFFVPADCFLFATNRLLALSNPRIESWWALTFLGVLV